VTVQLLAAPKIHDGFGGGVDLVEAGTAG
jgi:hypothetical protein